MSIAGDTGVNRIKKFKKSTCLKMVFALVLFLLLTGIIVKCTQAMINNAEKEAQEYLENSTISTAKEIKSKMEGDMSVLRAISDFAGSHNAFDGNHILPILKSFCEHETIQRMGIVYPDGSAVGMNNFLFNASDREYFKRGIAGEAFLSPVICDRFYNYPINVYTVPIYQKGEAVAVLFATRNSTDFNGDLNCENNDKYHSYTSIINSKGEALFLDEHDFISEVGLNAFDKIDSLDFEEGNAKQVKEDILSGREGTFKYKSTKENNIEYVYYTPVGVNDWYVISFVPQDIVFDYSYNYRMIAYTMSTCMVAIILLIIGVISMLQRNKNKEIKCFNRRLNLVTANMQAAVTQNLRDENLTICYMNEGLCRITGYSEQELESEFDNSLLKLIPESDRKVVSQQIKLQLDLGDSFEREHKIIKKDGSECTVNSKGVFIEDEQGHGLIYCTIMDISEKQNILKALSEKTDELMQSRIMMQEALVHSNLYTFEYLIKEKKIILDDKIVEQCGGMDSVIENAPQGLRDVGMVDEECMDAVWDAFNKLNSGKLRVECIIKRTDSKECVNWSRVTITKVEGYENLAMGIVHDITANKEREVRLEVAAQMDQMTGLYNKVATEMLISKHLERAEPDCFHAMIIIDIDNFKAVNDTMGHIEGDNVLIKVSYNLKGLFRSTDIIGRIGGDEFMVLLVNAPNLDLIHKKAEEICEMFRSTFAGHNDMFKISGSVGISIYGRDGETFKDLYLNADTALYKVKQRGKDMYAFHSEIEEEGEVFSR